MLALSEIYIILRDIFGIKLKPDSIIMKLGPGH